MMSRSEPVTGTIPSFLRHAGNDASVRSLAVRYRILGVAKHRFARFGYDGTSLTDIAHGADVSPAELLLHFNDKLAILMAVFDTGWASLNPRLRDIFIASMTAHDAILAILAMMMNSLERDEDFARILLFDGRRLHPDSGEIVISEGYRSFVRLCTELVRRGQTEGSFSTNHDPRIVATMLIGAIEALMRDSMFAEQEGGLSPYSGSELIAAFDAMVSRYRPRQEEERIESRISAAAFASQSR